MSIEKAMGYSDEQIFDFKLIPEERKCGNCKYWADTEVCCCADSNRVADFTCEDFVCEFHEYEDGETDEMSL